MIEKNVQIALGGVLMTREAAKLAHELKEHRARVLLRRGEMTVNGKSLMGIVSLGIRDGQTVTVIADGEDEAEAIERRIAAQGDDDVKMNLPQ